MQNPTIKRLPTFYKKTTPNDVIVKAIDDDNNYSICSKNDPEPSGYTDHIWGSDTAEWHEISKAEAEAILGYSLEN